MIREGDVLFRLGTSLKDICEKSNFQSEIFATIFMIMNGHTFKLVKNIFNDFLIESKMDIHMF